ncbi:arylsulfatase I-like [Macrobrachium rosenbergii]|uniref:arylsulfatase I-like n=1 Tax=Macrobrachium rosenbergii TaxID=79674 RepID=UPI0034D3C900
MSRREGKYLVVLRFLALQICITVGVTSESPASSSKPHIIFILADDLGWYDVSWHNPKALTPNLETLAKEGIILDRSYVQPLCTPTRSALLTGRYPFTIGRQHGVLTPRQPTGLILNATLLPQALKEAGYSTHAVGKWHLGFCHWDYTPTYRGFDTFFGYYNGGQDHYFHSSGTKWNGTINEDEPAFGYDFRNNMDVDLSVNGTYDTDAYSSHIEDLLSTRNPDDPMFLYFALQSIHTPLQVPEDYREPFKYIGDEEREIVLAMSWAMDDAVGRVVDALKATGHYDNSIIIFSSDNGGHQAGANNWPLRGAKGSLWEGGTRAAGFIHSPLLPKAGFVSDTVVHVTDWYATLAGLAGGRVPENTDGFDQWEALTSGTTAPRTSFVYNIDNSLGPDNTTQIKAALRKGDYKMIVGNPGDGSWTLPPEGLDTEDILYGYNTLGNDNPSTAGIRLFNVIDDPEERSNIAELHYDIVEDMMADLLSELLRLVPADLPPNDPSSNPKYFGGAWSPGWCQV